MTKGVDGVCRHIDPLIHRYLVDAAAMRSDDMALRPFAYTLMFFSQCANIRHFSHHDVISDTVSVSVVTTPSVLYHYPIRFSSNLHSFLTRTPPSSLSGLVVPPTNEVCLSFDSVVNCFGSHLLSWPGSNVAHSMLETSILHFRIATFFNSHSSIRLTTLSQIQSSTSAPSL